MASEMDKLFERIPKTIFRSSRRSSFLLQVSQSEFVVKLTLPKSKQLTRRILLILKVIIFFHETISDHYQGQIKHPHLISFGIVFCCSFATAFDLFFPLICVFLSGIKLVRH